MSGVRSRLGSEYCVPCTSVLSCGRRQGRRRHRPALRRFLPLAASSGTVNHMRALIELYLRFSHLCAHARRDDALCYLLSEQRRATAVQSHIDAASARHACALVLATALSVCAWCFTTARACRSGSTRCLCLRMVQRLNCMLDDGNEFVLYSELVGDLLQRRLRDSGAVGAAVSRVLAFDLNALR